MVKVIEFDTLFRYVRKVRIEFAIVALVACVVIIFGAIAGVAVGIVVSFVANFARSHMSGQEKLMGFVVEENEDEPEIPSNMVVEHFEGFLSFRNVDHRIEETRKCITEGIDTVILDISDVTNIDATASEAIRMFIQMLDSGGYYVRVVRRLAIANDRYTRYELQRIMECVDAYPTVQSAIDDVNSMKNSELLDIPINT